MRSTRSTRCSRTRDARTNSWSRGRPCRRRRSRPRPACRRARRTKSGRQWLDLLHDVTVADAEIALAEGYEHIELLKRYTTCGMAVDQGKTSQPQRAPDRRGDDGEEPGRSRHHDLPPALHAGHARRARRTAARRALCAEATAARRTRNTRRSARTGGKPAAGCAPPATRARARPPRRRCSARPRPCARASASSTPRRSARSRSPAPTPRSSSTASTSTTWRSSRTAGSATA